MPVFKCKMCGGDLQIGEKDTVAQCSYCGTQQTLPKDTDEVMANLFNRANNLRLKSEFDKALEVYDKILETDNANAEAHWGAVLCKYGVEYVEDPKSRKMIPTCHRTQYESVLTDAGYLAALANADGSARAVYEREAKQIADLQKDILAVVSREKPFDVFICYKETDASGARTRDSALANDIYHHLTQEGYKVFYAAITLEDKLGQEYEPYIFAALHSAKVMLAVGTRPEHFNAPWVKNEWSRYLQIMKKESGRTLIPCFSGMDAYDLPEEFAHLQALDMTKIGFIADLSRGIGKLVRSAQPPLDSAGSSTLGVNSQALMDRAFICLEDGEWQKADELLEQALNLDPRNPRAYVGKLMISTKAKKEEDLSNAREPLTANPLFNRVLGFADKDLYDRLNAYNSMILTRREQEEKASTYHKAKHLMNTGKNKADFLSAAETFKTIPQYADADALAAECKKIAEKAEFHSKKVRKILIITIPTGLLILILLIMIIPRVLPYRIPDTAKPAYGGINIRAADLRDIGEIPLEEQQVKADATKAKGDKDVFEFFALTDIIISEPADHLPIVLGNPEKNNCTFIISLVDREGRLMAHTLGLPSGKYLPYITLIDQHMPYGEYNKLKLVVSAYDPETNAYLGSQYTDFHLVVGIKNNE